MEQVFIKQIFNLTAKILGNDIEFETAKSKLESALAHAQRLQMAHYEAEILNTFGILYGLQGDVVKQMYYFQQAYQFIDKVQQDDYDFLLKITNNLGSGYLGAWQLDDGRSILQRGVDRINEEKLDLLASVYIYSNLISLHILDGIFQQADEEFTTAWQLAERVKIKNYSRIEFFIIVMELHRQKAMIDIALGHSEQAVERLSLAEGQLQQSKRDDLRRGIDFVRMYHALICEADTTKASAIETKLLAGTEQFTPDEALNAAYFLKYNEQQQWADRYAQMVLDAKSDTDIFQRLHDHAKKIMADEDTIASSTS